MEQEHSAIPLPPASSPDPTQMQMMPQTPQTKSLAAQSGGVVLSETQLGNMALRAKQQRCKAEQDRQLLQNRINRLVIEQEKASKRIAETRRRAEEIRTLKARNEANSEARKDAGAWLASEQELQRELLKENRQERQKAIIASRQSMHALKHDEVKVLKSMRHENEDAVFQQREMERQRAVERKSIVQMSQAAAMQRKQAENEALRQRLREKREEKRQEVDQDAMSHLNAYSSLAEEEQRLIASLAKWNQIQTDAHEQLEGVVANSKASSRAASRPSSRAPLPTAQTDDLDTPPKGAPPPDGEYGATPPQ